MPITVPQQGKSQNKEDYEKAKEKVR